jgi:pimeloyl-ACP methyl ester carboxylesterase/DNA-binding CsgD family transcriptional regulator
VQNNTSPVIKKMATMDENALEFDNLVQAWNKLCEQTKGDVDLQFADIENAAISALAEQSNDSRAGQIGNEISRMLSGFDYPTYLVTGDGRVAALNTSALLEFARIGIGDTVDLLPFTLDKAQEISTLVSGALRDENHDASDAVLRRAYGEGAERDVTIAVTPAGGDVPTALVFVITPRWKPKSVELLKRQFGLTNAESEVLVNFIDGYSSENIATLRNRSHTTIKTQLQSILNKTGARSQTELLRIVLSLSDFTKEISPITDALTHPYRRRAIILREGGRRIEFTLMGDFNGKPMVTVATASFYTLTAEVEKVLHDEELCIISVCTPGCGQTDPAIDKAVRLQTFCSDIAAVLDLQKIDKCPLLAITHGSPICYYLARHLPDRFSHLVQMNAAVPLKFAAASKTQSPWINGILRACDSHPTMGKLLLKGGCKAWASIGASNIMRFQLSSNPVDAEFALRPENLTEFEHALKTATANGIASAVEDMYLAFGDWTENVKESPIRVTILHGEQDRLFHYDAVQEFVAHFSDKVALLSYSDAGFCVVFKHPLQVIRSLRSVVERYYE